MFQLVFFIRQHLFLENKLIKRLLLLHKYMNYQILYVSHMLKKKKSKNYHCKFTYKILFIKLTLKNKMTLATGLHIEIRF